MTAAFEICESLGDAPDMLALPVGNAGNITAYARGFARWHELGRAARRPRLLGAQAAGAAPLVRGHPIENPETVATAIRIGRPATWQPAIDAARDSGGMLRAVTDDEILAAWRTVARLEGIFCEPASAAGLAALRAAVTAGEVRPHEQCIVVLTGNGLKDPATAAQEGITGERIEATVDALARLLGI
jgi:threonine synthase